MIINADDLGLGASENRGIFAAFDGGLVSSATVTANMPGFAEACELVHEKQLLAAIGIHLVLTDGVPLTEPIRRLSRFCDDDGNFRRWAGSQRLVFLSRRERSAVAEELRAQIASCRRAELPLTHADSHHHVHFEPAIARIVMSLCREQRIPFVRTIWNVGEMSSRRRAAAAVLNAGLGRRGLRATRYAGEVIAWQQFRDGGASREALQDFELAAHPAFHDGKLVDMFPSPQSLDDVLAPLRGVPLVSYGAMPHARAISGS